MSLIRGVLRGAGATRLGGSLIRLAARLGQHRVLSTHQAGRAVETLVAAAPRMSMVVPVDVGGPSPVPLELDLSIPGCRNLLVTPLRRSKEWASLRLFCALAGEATTVMDVGANVGLYTYAAATCAPRAGVHAFEPTPALASLITRNIARNGWAPRVRVRASGVSDRAGTLEFHVRATDGESTFEPARIAGGEADGVVRVGVVALDDVFEFEHIDPASTLLKIDVEGHETRVLDGLRRTLGPRGQRPTLLMEFLGRAIADDRIIDRVVGYGYTVYYVASRALIRVRSTADFGRVQELDHWNFLLTERLASMSGLPTVEH